MAGVVGDPAPRSYVCAFPRTLIEPRQFLRQKKKRRVLGVERAGAAVGQDHGGP
jgi:hypothetical protein